MRAFSARFISEMRIQNTSFYMYSPGFSKQPIIKIEERLKVIDVVDLCRCITMTELIPNLTNLNRSNSNTSIIIALECKKDKV